MVTTVVKCYRCNSDKLVKNGHAPNGKQRYLCKDCQRASLDNPDYGYSEAKQEEILRAYQRAFKLAGCQSHVRRVQNYSDGVA